MKNIILLLVAFSIIKTTNAQWFSQTSNTVNNLSSVCFVNSDTGFAVGDSGTIVKTTNGGVDWLVQPPLTSYALTSICFINSNIGYTVGQYGRIYKTTDGGDNWLSQTSDTTLYFNSVTCINDSIAFVCGKKENYGYILKTNNGGITWTTSYILNESSSTSNELYSIHFSDSSNGSAVGYFYIPYSSYPIILKTTDGGISWTKKYPIGKPLMSVYHLNPDTAFTVGWSNISDTYIHNTYDGWNTILWKLISTNKSLYSIFFPNVMTGYSVGETGTILKTTDGGINWNIQLSNTTENLSSVYFINDSVGYTVGSNGTILKTTDGGIISNIDNNIIKMTDILIYPNLFKDIIQIECPQNTSVEIINTQGQIIKNITTTNTNTTIDLTKLVSGVYIIRAKTNKGIITKELIKE